jgi:hypothetical protein
MNSMIAVQIIPDRFASVLAGPATAAARSGAVYDKVRRPTRGLVLKSETFATLQVTKGNGDCLLLADGGSRLDPRSEGEIEAEGRSRTPQYSNFLLQSVRTERMEKQQILETFGEPYIFFFGERARIMQFAGVLMNSEDFDWEAEWWYNYENYLRGTRCVENDARVYLSFDDTLVSGYILSAQSEKNAEHRNWVNLQFQMFVTGDVSIGKLVGDPRANAGRWGRREPVMSEKEADQYRPVRIDPFHTPQGMSPADWKGSGLQVKIGQMTVQQIASGLEHAAGHASTIFEQLDNAGLVPDGLLGSGPSVIKAGWDSAAKAVRSLRSSVTGAVKSAAESVANSAAGKWAASAGKQTAGAIKTASEIGNEALALYTDLKNLWSRASTRGTPIRLPVGFAGMLAFEEGFVPIARITPLGKVQYTTYSKNDDEYVGYTDRGSAGLVSDHYASAAAGKWVKGLGAPRNEFNRGLAAVEYAKKVWEAHGYEIDPSSYGSLYPYFADPTNTPGLVQIHGWGSLKIGGTTLDMDVGLDPVALVTGAAQGDMGKSSGFGSGAVARTLDGKVADAAGLAHGRVGSVAAGQVFGTSKIL